MERRHQTRTIGGAIIVATGAVWVGQGTGLVRGGSFMVGDPLWIVFGALASSWASPSCGSGCAVGREPRLPGRLGRSGRHGLAVANERQAQQARVVEESLDDARPRRCVR